MDLVYDLLVVAHLVGMAAILGSWMVVRAEPRVPRVMVDGAGAQLLTGLLLVGIAESGLVEKDLDMAKIGVKLVVAAAILAVVLRARRRDTVSRRSLDVVGGLALVDVAVAVLW